MYTPTQALEAIKARINGDLTNTELLKMGVFTPQNTEQDILRIIEQAQPGKQPEQVKTDPKTIKELLETISTDPDKRPHFELINWMDEEADDKETGFISLDEENARILIEYLITRFPALVV